MGYNVDCFIYFLLFSFELSVYHFIDNLYYPILKIVKLDNY